MAMTTLSSMAALGPHVLPPLPYVEGALSPFISARTVALHRDQHHQGYVDALNKAVVGTPYADLSLQQIVIATANQTEHAAVFNNAAQVWNHNFYWQSLRPQGGGEPPASIKPLIEACFGNVAACKAALAAAAAKRFGSGWVWLVLEAGELKVLDTGNAHAPQLAQPTSAAGHRRVGTRVLPGLPEPARRICDGAARQVDQLGFRGRQPALEAGAVSVDAQ